MTEIRNATEQDWSILDPFFSRIYRPDHPVRNFEFWKWQFLHNGRSSSIIACDGDRVVGHIGAYFREGYSWLINGYVDERFRGGGGLPIKLIDAARDVGPLAGTNVNAIAMNLYRRLGWIRYVDLQRYVAINPSINDAARLCEPIKAEAEWTTPDGDHYWKQPGVSGFLLPGGSTAVNRLDVGGLRIIDLIDVDAAVSACWKAGVAWVDFVTSWNDPLCRELERRDWKAGDKSPVPWLLDPIVPGSQAKISYLSEHPMPREFIVKRTFSDHGRVGSLPVS